VDWDRLADHLGGALSGPDEAEVARLVATDPGWAGAASELATAFEAVTADLRSLPQPDLPDEITAQLEAALRSAGTEPAAGSAAAGVPGPRATEPGRAVDATPGTPPGTTAPPGRAGAPGRPAGEDRRPPGRPRPRSRRRRVAQLGGGLAAAAGAVAFAAIGFAIWSPSQPLIVGGGEDRGESAGEPTVELERPVNGAADGPTIVATGTDYQPPTVGADEPDAPGEAIPGTPELGTADNRDPIAQPRDDMPPAERVPDLVPPRLARMWVDPAAREACLAEIRTALGPAPVTIETVDFAQFESSDALVIWATQADQTRVVSVSGPACGTPGAGPDQLFQDQLG
jgi:hypothetical protein